MNATGLSPLEGSGRVTVIGAGNIGSHPLPLVGRIPAVRSVTIIDHDSYEEKNVTSQAISRADLGQPKAAVQARRLREINPRLQITPLVERIENAPPAALRGDVLLGCLDSRLSRRIASRMAWRLGMPMIDAGVQPDGMLARIRVYRPDPASACLECMWDEEDYLAEQERFACDGSRVEAAPTNAPASLGALAAALQAIELEKILTGDWERVATGHEVLIDAKSHRHIVTRLQRNAACRFDHGAFALREFAGSPEALTLADLLAVGSSFLRVEGQQFARQWACTACQTTRDVFGLRDRIAASVRCQECDRGMRAVGFHSLDRLTAADIPDGLFSAPLSSLGFREGDIFTGVVSGDEVHFEIINPTMRQL